MKEEEEDSAGKRDPAYYKERIPNLSKPWCARCRLHTEYDCRRAIGSDGSGSGAVTFICKKCGGQSFKIGNPVLFSTLSVLLIVFLSCLSLGALSYVKESPEYVILPAATAYAGYYLYRSGQANRRRWKEFRSWARSKRF
jgi:hypothetical protein